jgi:hypothetical protein
MSHLSCTHEGCDRSFFDRASLVEHDVAVHSFNTARNLLSRSVRENYGKEAFVMDLSSEWVVFEMWDPNMDSYRTFRTNYTLEEGSASATFDGEVVEVIQTTVWMPVKDESAGVQGSTVYADGITTVAHPIRAGSEVAATKSKKKPGEKPHAFAPGDEGSCKVCGQPKNAEIHGDSKGE